MTDAREAQLVQEFREHAATRGRKIDEGRPATANKSADKMVATYLTMKRELRDSAAALVSLANDQDQWIALPAAAILLEYNPRLALPILERLSKSENPVVSLNAEMTVREHRAGRLRPLE